MQPWRVHQHIQWSLVNDDEMFITIMTYDLKFGVSPLFHSISDLFSDIKGLSKTSFLIGKE